MNIRLFYFDQTSKRSLVVETTTKHIRGMVLMSQGAVIELAIIVNILTPLLLSMTNTNKNYLDVCFPSFWSSYKSPPQSVNGSNNESIPSSTCAHLPRFPVKLRLRKSADTAWQPLICWKWNQFRWLLKLKIMWSLNSFMLTDQVIRISTCYGTVISHVIIVYRSNLRYNCGQQ